MRMAIELLVGMSAAVRAIAELIVDNQHIRRLITIPGVDVVTAVTLRGAIGDVRRFPSPRQLVGYLGLHPKMRQSGLAPARPGRTSMRVPRRPGTCWSTRPGRLRTAPGRCERSERVGARRGRSVATVAVARKLAVLAWHLLTRGEDHAFARPSIVARKRRRLELAAGAPGASPGPTQTRSAPTASNTVARGWSPTRPRPPTGA
jgi:transposase